ncbi:HopJ type III effector protein [Pseudomonadota bacterium]
MILDAFLQTVKENPETVEFNQTIALIDETYKFVPTTFHNGDLVNEAGQNSGSCKIFAFGQLHNLSEQQTLACFGHYYREEVLQHPDGSNHQNIRNFIKTGWTGIKFSSEALT